MSKTVHDVTLVIFTYPNQGGDIVLQDWIDFAGDTVTHLLIVSPASFRESPIFHDWKARFPTLEYLFIGEADKHPDQYYSLGVLTAMEQISTAYCLFVKLDVLPYRKGNEGWLQEGIEKIQATGAFAMTGSERWPHTQMTDGRYGKTSRISLNFAVYKPKEYLEIVRASNPAFVKLAYECKVSFEDRFSLESSVETWLEANGRFNLVRHEDTDWSVFHVHQFGDALLRIRESYRDRVGIKKFLNRIEPDRQEPWDYHPWDRYFGMPRPNLLKRLRIQFGAWRRRTFGNE